MTSSLTPDADQDPLIEQMRSRRAQLDPGLERPAGDPGRSR
jgi:hypothetical protein